MEGGGQLPWIPPAEIAGYGFQMILYPTTVLFRVAHAIREALQDLHAGLPLAQETAVTLDEFENMVGLPGWSEIEDQFRNG
jgi:2-methylisocitrate lyase-like PEP mutase family enzyme